MQKTAQAWFTGGSSSPTSGAGESQPSLLADWNSYAASRSDASSSSPLPFDIEAAVRSANDTVSGTFSVMTKGVRELPGTFQSATSSFPSGKALMYFGLFLASGIFFVFIAFALFLPVMVLMPQKFAICFTLGCALIIASLFALKGPASQFAHMTSKERLPFTVGFIGCMVGTIYVSIVLHSYFFSVIFSILQVLALAYYTISYFPGGSSGLKFISSSLLSSVTSCFGRHAVRNCGRMASQHVYLIDGEEPAAPARWFISLAFLGAAYVAAVTQRLVVYIALCLRRPKDLRRRYGAWAVVTGPTSGIGRSMALELARWGIHLVLVDLNAANLREISDTVRSRHGVQTKTVVFDLSLVSTPQGDDTDTRIHGDEALRRLREAVEGLDVGVLVNNAGISKPCALYLHEADVEAWVRMMRVNLWAPTEVTAAVLPGMVERGRGAVVNIGSASSEAIPSFPLYTMYAATKRYVAEFSRRLYVEYASKGIDVQCQAPFFVATRMVSNMAAARRLSPFVATPDAYARAAARWIGHGGPLCTPCPGHQLLWLISAAVPDFVHDRLRLRDHLRQRTLFKRIRASRAAAAAAASTTRAAGDAAECSFPGQIDTTTALSLGQIGPFQYPK
ncbi:hypothetical protein ABZP36_021049 [Zizania latifolia]